MDRNDCDISTTCNWKSWLSDLCHESYMANGSHSAVSEIAGSRHTLACSLSKLRSSIEAGKKQLRVWLQYVCGVTEMLRHPFFCVPFVLLWSPYCDSEMARSGFEDGSKWCALGNACRMANEAIFMSPRIYVHGKMNLYSFFDAMI